MSVASIAGNVVRDPFKEEDGKPLLQGLPSQKTLFKGKTSPVYMVISPAGVAEVVKKHVNKASFDRGRTFNVGSYKRTTRHFIHEILLSNGYVLENFSIRILMQKENQISDTYNEDKL